MIRNYLKKHMRDDEAISPVIGTILMVAATVIIGGAVYAAVNAYSGKASRTTSDAAFKAQALDTDSDGLEDTIKVTYLSGPRDLGTSAVVMTLKDSGGVSLTNALSGGCCHATASKWNAGDYEMYKLASASGTPAGSTGNVYASIAVGDTTVLDQTLSLREFI